MSVNTTADDKLNEVRKNIKDAIDNLNCIVVEQYWGHDEYTKEFHDIIYDTFHKLIEIRRKLGD